MRVTIKDVATRAGVSTATVSLVLNNRPVAISQQTKDAVMTAAKELNYRPNQLAVSLVTRKSNVLGLIIPDNSNIYYAQLSKYIEAAANAAGYSLIYGNTNDSGRMDLHYLKLFTDQCVDGIIYAQSADATEQERQECIDYIHSMRIPIVCIDRPVPNLSIPSVVLDNVTGGYLATRHLLESGHRVIGCCVGPKELESSRQRLAGYCKALEEYGVPFEERLIYEGNYSMQSGQEALPYLLGQNITGIFAFNDMMAFGIYKALHSYALSAPQDISIVGFDDIFFAEIVQPPLTTIAQPVPEMANAVVDKLLKMIQNPTVPADTEPQKFLPVLKVRGSTHRI